MKGRLLLILAMSLVNLGYAQLSYNVSFEHITTEEGLSNNQVNGVLEDKYGVIWIGTLSGLNRYDGYDFQIFSSEGSEDYGLTNSTVMWMQNGPDSTVWIQTGNGTSIYNPKTESFINLETWTDKLGIRNQGLQGMINSNNYTWFRIENNGLVRYDDLTGQVWSLNSSDSSIVRLESNDILEVGIDKNDNAWVLYANGYMDVIDHNLGAISRKFDFSDVINDYSDFDFFVDSNLDLWIYSSRGGMDMIFVNTLDGERKYLDASILGSIIVTDVVEDKKGFIWIGSDHGGITIVDKNNWKSKAVKYQGNNKNSLGNNNVKSLYRSSSGIIWVGMNRNGVSYFSENSSKISHYKVNLEDPTYNDMLSLAEDQNGDLWIGTNGKGLLKFDVKHKSFSKPIKLDKAVNKQGLDVVVSLEHSSDNSLWIGTYTKGLIQLKNGQFQNYNSKSKPAISDDNVWCITEDHYNNLWLGTIDGGVDRFNPLHQTIKNYNQTDGLPLNYVTDVLEGPLGRLWFGTGNGISVYDPSLSKFKNYYESDSLYSLSNNSIVSIYEDVKGDIWVGTLNGLNKFLPNKDGFKVYSKNDGLASNIVMSIVQDLEGYLWVSSDNGVSKIDIENDKFDVQTFNVSDGLQGAYFNERTSLITSNGYLAFAGQNGLNFFDPNSIVVDNREPNLVFTEFYINNNRVRPNQLIDEDVVISKNINSTRELNLSHDQNSFAFAFAALTYDQAMANQYEYTLEGFENEWVKSESGNRRAVYTNINPGTYHFKVRASNSHNVWNEYPRVIKIVIDPPIWKTKAAYALYILIIVGLLYLVRQLIVIRERERASLENVRLDAQRLHDLDLLKLKFFTNISHEFRTPISLVLTPIERMINNPESRRDMDFQIIHRNAKRLLTLVNQLLDFRKMEANQHKLSLASGDLIMFFEDVIESFSDMIIEKEVSLDFACDMDQYYCQFDKDKMDKIMFNLLSNAFKFTLPGGRIEVVVEKNEGLMITVNDSGIGIPKDKLEVIFDRFIQSDLDSSMVNSGTGIGLSITKEFVELHNGTIKVESNLDQGSSFIVDIPFEQLKNQGEVKVEEEPLVATKVEHDLTIKGKRPTIFLVEDNSDFRFYIKDNLAFDFTMREAANGKDAWKQIVNDPPDIIISDVMMPIMSGLELCRKVKSDPRTADIPVILLTAQTSNEHKLEGLRAGALEYVTKPFNFEILVSTINSALKFQKNVTDASKKLEVETSEMEIVSLDEKFLLEAVKLVEENLSNSDFSVEFMSHELGYSRGHLYQKMLHVVGKTPLDFIRDIRMEHAAEFLAKSQLTVSEIAYKVGYNNPKLFSRYFKSKYKTYPSKYQTDQTDQRSDN